VTSTNESVLGPGLEHLAGQLMDSVQAERPGPDRMDDGLGGDARQQVFTGVRLIGPPGKRQQDRQLLQPTDQVREPAQ